MPISPRTDKYLHSKLPIDEDEKILAIYKHHWFAYASSWIVGIIVAVLIMGVAFAFASVSPTDSGQAMLTQNQTVILVGAGVLSTAILLGTCIPVYLRSQEQLVLTEEALLQVLQPSLFSSKIDQVGLQHITDVSVNQDFFGTLLGFGHITLETPGEQNNYKFAMLPDPHRAAREIIAAHENYDAALQAGRVKTTIGSALPEAPQIDPQQYQQFLQYQQMVAQQKQQTDQANDPTRGAQTPTQNQ
jgi:hypothetical protein